HDAADRRLARTVLAQQAMHLPGLYVERYAIDGPCGAETLVHVAQFKQRRTGCWLSVCRRRSDAHDCPLCRDLPHDCDRLSACRPVTLAYWTASMRQPCGGRSYRSNGYVPTFS